MALMLKELPAASSPLAKTMSKAKPGGADGKSAAPAGRSDKDSSDAFDVWLQQGLHKLYDSVAKEPIPDELLELIERDFAKREK